MRTSTASQVGPAIPDPVSSCVGGEFRPAGAAGQAVADEHTGDQLVSGELAGEVVHSPLIFGGEAEQIAMLFHLYPADPRSGFGDFQAVIGISWKQGPEKLTDEIQVADWLLPLPELLFDLPPAQGFGGTILFADGVREPGLDRSKPHLQNLGVMKLPEADDAKPASRSRQWQRRAILGYRSESP